MGIDQKVYIYYKKKFTKKNLKFILKVNILMGVGGGSRTIWIFLNLLCFGTLPLYDS